MLALTEAAEADVARTRVAESVDDAKLEGTAAAAVAVAAVVAAVGVVAAGWPSDPVAKRLANAAASDLNSWGACPDAN